MRGRFRRAVDVTRYPLGAFTSGAWVQADPFTVVIQASVQPASAEDMQRLPEGRRNTGAVKLFTNDKLRVEQGKQKADRVTISQGEYEVATADIWENGIISHNAYICARVLP